jgi:hypothetical protein
LVARAAGVLAARLAGAEPLAALAAGFFAGVLVAVRFTGSSVAGLALVAATYTLSIVLAVGGRGRTRPKASAIRNIGVDLVVDSCRYPVGGRRGPL